MSQLIDLPSLSKLSFMVLPSCNPMPEHVEYYNNAYETWLNVWQSAYKELELNKEIYSDEFTRHSDINCIFYGKQCVASVHSRIVNITLPTTRNDSYFRLWTDDDLNAVKKFGSQIMIISNMSVNHEWRKNNCEISMKDLIIYLCCQRFSSSRATAMATFTRNSKNIHKLIERFGAITVRSGVTNFNQDDLVDLFVFTKDSVTEGTHPGVIKLGRKLLSEMASSYSPLQKIA